MLLPAAAGQGCGAAGAALRVCGSVGLLWAEEVGGRTPCCAGMLLGAGGWVSSSGGVVLPLGHPGDVWGVGLRRVLCCVPGESLHGYRICIQALLLDRPKIATGSLGKVSRVLGNVLLLPLGVPGAATSIRACVLPWAQEGPGSSVPPGSPDVPGPPQVPLSHTVRSLKSLPEACVPSLLCPLGGGRDMSVPGSHGAQMRVSGSGQAGDTAAQLPSALHSASSSVSPGLGLGGHSVAPAPTSAEGPSWGLLWLICSGVGVGWSEALPH